DLAFLRGAHPDGDARTCASLARLVEAVQFAVVVGGSPRHYAHADRRDVIPSGKTIDDRLRMPLHERARVAGKRGAHAGHVTGYVESRRDRQRSDRVASAIDPFARGGKPVVIRERHRSAGDAVVVERLRLLDFLEHLEDSLRCADEHALERLRKATTLERVAT